MAKGAGNALQMDFTILKLKLTLDVDDPRYLMALKRKIIKNEIFIKHFEKINDRLMYM